MMIMIMIMMMMIMMVNVVVVNVDVKNLKSYIWLTVCWLENWLNPGLYGSCTG